jgi:hypothetical protein
VRHDRHGPVKTGRYHADKADDYAAEINPVYIRIETGQ